MQHLNNVFIVNETLKMYLLLMKHLNNVFIVNAAFKECIYC